MDASLRLRFVQHDKTEDVIPHTSEESSAMWMLRFAQHDKTEDVIPHTSEESSAWMLHCACASFSMTRPKMSFRTQ